MSYHCTGRRRGEFISLVMPFTLIILLVGSDEMVLSPMLWKIANAFQVSVVQAALAVSVYGLALAFGAPVLTRIGERKGLGVALGLGMGGLAVSSLLCACSSTFFEFLLGRFLSGLAAGLTVPSTYALAGQLTADQFRGQALGWVVSGWSWSFILGVPLATWMGRGLGWRSVFLTFAIAATILSLFMAWSHRGTRVSSNQDGPRVAADPRRVRADRATRGRVVALVIATFGNMFGFYGMYALFGEAWHLRAAHVESGALLLAYGTGFATSVVTGRWADQWGRQRTLVRSLLALAFVLLALPFAMHNAVMVCLVLFVWGALQSVAVTLLTAVFTEQAGEIRESVMGWYSFATNIAVTIAPAIAGWLDVRGGYVSVALLCAAMTLAAAHSARFASHDPRDSRIGGDRASSSAFGCDP
ncbi:MFS transporter [Alicyclobacillus vulcanalis]|uniref:Predicted arabinose efflux permease, MFS family n=1 Tax=Alicyclobacillus vulcanalis TaxID=252246 RepID=A0A1N7LIP5_9BACL|nr:MFS transporter [Alicyclobacillus vulcanalis]SIS73654.1 Predicted arabinose efflux permease, MFS family [Alicyclobacillus vulcanalis]